MKLLGKKINTKNLYGFAFQNVEPICTHSYFAIIILLCILCKSSNWKYLTFVFSCISLNISAIAHYIKGSFVSSLIYILYRFGYKSLLDIWLTNIFFHYIACLFIFLTVSIKEQKFLIVMKSNANFLLMGHAFGVVHS